MKVNNVRNSTSIRIKSIVNYKYSQKQTRSLSLYKKRLSTSLNKDNLNLKRSVFLKKITKIKGNIKTKDIKKNSCKIKDNFKSTYLFLKRIYKNEKQQNSEFLKKIKLDESDIEKYEKKINVTYLFDSLSYYKFTINKLLTCQDECLYNNYKNIQYDKINKINLFYNETSYLLETNKYILSVLRSLSFLTNQYKLREVIITASGNIIDNIEKFSCHIINFRNVNINTIIFKDIFLNKENIVKLINIILNFTNLQNITFQGNYNDVDYSIINNLQYKLNNNHLPQTKIVKLTYAGKTTNIDNKKKIINITVPKLCFSESGNNIGFEFETKIKDIIKSRYKK
ncbi:MAG TPA: hypothetical protein QKA14_02770 [Candidatus Megaira endosymbiont of Hartmannula sinica]|nr:hypothetical protein [Candidatus Megaera endosymbiont of Hartmannula sinica]